MLLLDTFWAHLVDTVKKLLEDVGAHLVVVLGCMTSQLHPLGVGINRLFKDRLNQVNADWMRSGEPVLTYTGRFLFLFF